mmetsp:Transcript_47646/g.89168  ORF Transcript_47646/g.89168 Transcript_47646/m.89168 type:complete len:208 (+) Transcript_47646:648-1271(+)
MMLTWFFLYTLAISLMIIGTSLAKLMKTIVQLEWRSLLKPISLPQCTWIVEMSMGPAASSSPSPMFPTDRIDLSCCIRLACWCFTQYWTASSTVGKNHWSPMNFLRPAFRRVFSTRLPTIANATCIPLMRKSLTTSLITWQADESTLITGVISRTMYSVLLTTSRSVTCASSISLTKDAFAKYRDEPIRAMNTFWIKVPQFSCFIFR